MREVVFVMFGIAAGFAWMAVWTGVLHVFGVVPVGPKIENSATKRERLQRLGKPKYILFTVLKAGIAFGLAVITIDYASHRSAGSVSELIKFLFLSACFGLVQGFVG
jgi:hypothetical protein